MESSYKVGGIDVHKKMLAVCRGEDERQLLSGGIRRLVPRLGVKKAIWAIAHRICRLIWKLLRQDVIYIEQEPEARTLKPSGNERANSSATYTASVTKY